MDHSALYVTVSLSLLTATLLTALSLPFAWWIVFSGSRWSFVGEALLTLTLVLPPAVLGYLLLVLFSPDNIVGRFFAGILGHPLAFSFSGLLVASLLYSLPLPSSPWPRPFVRSRRRPSKWRERSGPAPLKLF